MLAASEFTVERCVALIEAVGLDYKDCTTVEEVNEKMGTLGEGGLVMAFMDGPFIFKGDDGTHVLVVPSDYTLNWGREEWTQIMNALKGKSALEQAFDLRWTA